MLTVKLAILTIPSSKRNEEFIHSKVVFKRRLSQAVKNAISHDEREMTI